MAKEAFWEKDAPTDAKSRNMSRKQVREAKARARAAGRPWPNLVDRCDRHAGWQEEGRLTMQPITRTTSDATAGAVYSTIVALDTWTSPFSIALSVRVTGTVNYTVQYTFDNIMFNNWTPASGNWVDHPSLTSKTGTLDSNIAYPVTAVRIVQNSGNGSTVLTVIQAGGGGNS